jgi:hypothetical protein
MEPGELQLYASGSTARNLNLRQLSQVAETKGIGVRDLCQQIVGESLDHTLQYDYYDPGLADPQSAKAGLGIPVSASLHRKFTKWAKRSSRTMSQQFTFVLNAWIDANGPEPPKPTNEVFPHYGNCCDLWQIFIKIIQDGKTKMAIAIFLKCADPQKEPDTIVLLSLLMGRLSQVDLDSAIGKCTYPERTLTINQIRDDLLRLYTNHCPGRSEKD